MPQGASVPADLKRNWLVVFGLVAILFLAKAVQAHARLAPLASDPCDAVNAFALLSMMMVAAGSAMTAMRAERSSAGRVWNAVYVLRGQQAIVLAVFALLAADAVALARQPELWIEKASWLQVLGALLALALSACLAEAVLLRSARSVKGIGATQPLRVAVVAALLIAMLAFCPEWPFDNATPTAQMLTVAAGALVVFLPVRILVRALVPSPAADGKPAWLAGSNWGFLLAGVLAGAVGFWSDMRHVSGSLRHLHPAALAVAIAGLLLAFGFLGEPLGLRPRPSPLDSPVAQAGNSASGSPLF